MLAVNGYPQTNTDVFAHFNKQLNTRPVQNSLPVKQSFTINKSGYIAAGAGLVLGAAALGFGLLKGKGKPKFTPQEQQMLDNSTEKIVERAMPKIRQLFEKYGVSTDLAARLHKNDLADIAQAKSIEDFSSMLAYPDIRRIFSTKDVLVSAIQDAKTYFKNQFIDKGILSSIKEYDGKVYIKNPSHYTISRKLNIPQTSVNECVQALDQALSDPAKLKLIKKDIIKNHTLTQLEKYIEEKLERVLSEMNFFNI